MSQKKPNVWARKKARRALVQATYQWQVSGNAFSTIRDDFAESDALKKADHEFFEGMLAAVIHSTAELDAHYSDLLDRPQAQLDQVEQAILRLATHEFKAHIEVPYRVVIDEYVELAKTFGAQDSYKYVNGILDKLAVRLRAVETGHG